MPHLWNDKIAVTVEELVPAHFNTWNTLKSLIRRNEERGTGAFRVLQIGGNGRKLLIDFDTLPEQYRNAIGDPRENSHPLEKYYKVDKEAVRFYQTYRFDDGGYLDLPYQEKYYINASVLKALIAFRKEASKMPKQRGGVDEILRQHATGFNKTLQTKHNCSHTLPESLKRFKDVLKSFENKGYAGLISGKHGNDNRRKVFENTMALLEGMFGRDNTKPTATDIYRTYTEFLKGRCEVINPGTGELFNPADFKELSESTVKQYLTEWQSRIATWGLRSGNRQQYRGIFIPAHSFDRPKYAGSLLSIDDRQPPFKMPDGKRVWFYMGIDLASEAFTCWVYGKSKEGIILEFYRQLVRNYAAWGLNLPDGLEAEMSLNSSFTETFLREGNMFQNVRIEANNARGKKIERYFRDLRYGLEKKREGWVARPFAISESNQAPSREPDTLYYDEIIENCLKDIETWNNMPHSIHTHLTRWEVFMDMQNPNLMPTNYTGFLRYLGRKETVSCGRGGKMRIRGYDYIPGENGKICFGASLINLLKRIEGKQVDIYWIDDDQGTPFKAQVYLDTLLICEAIKQPRPNKAVIEQTPEDIEAYELFCKYVSTVEAFARQRKNEIEPVIVIPTAPENKKTFVMPGLKQNAAPAASSGGKLPDPDERYEPVRSFVPNLRDTF